MRRFTMIAALLLLGVLAVPSAAFAQADGTPIEDDAEVSHEEIAPSEAPDPAQIAAMAKAVKQVPLSEDIVARFIASYPDMRATGTKFPATTPAGKHGEKDEEAEARVDLKAMTEEKRKAMAETAAKHGFKDLDEWATVGSSMSYMYAQQGKKPGALKQAIDVNIAEVKEDKTLTDKQKDEQIAQIRDLGDNLARLEPLPDNFALVERMKDKVAPIMKFE